MKQQHANHTVVFPPPLPAGSGEATPSPPSSSVRQMQVVADSRTERPARPGTPALRRLCYSQQEMLEILPLSERKLFSMRQLGEIPFVKVGDRVLYPVDEIHAWWERLKNGGVN